MAYETEVLLTGLRFGEGPRWHDGRLWFSDFYRHGIFTVDLDGNEELVLEVPEQPSGLGWLPDGDLLFVSMLDRDPEAPGRRRVGASPRGSQRDRGRSLQRHGGVSRTASPTWATSDTTTARARSSRPQHWPSWRPMAPPAAARATSTSPTARHQPRWPPAGHRRIVGPAPQGLRHRIGWVADQRASVRRSGPSGFPTASASTPRAVSGWPIRAMPRASGWWRAARSPITSIWS